MAEFIGLTVDGFYLEQQIGSGGMAEVYLGVDGSGRRAAVKIAHPHLCQSEAFRRSFAEAAARAARLQHAAILPVLAHGEFQEAQFDHPLSFLRLPYAAGGSLRRTLLRYRQQQRPFPHLVAVQIGQRLAAALHAAHRRETLHLDVKPANVLLLRPDDLGSVVLADFGLTPLPHSRSAGQTQPFVGTPPYMAPEQLEGVAVDGRADLFALGVLLYQLIVGQRPFTAETPVGVYRQQRDGPDWPAALPADLAAILQTALAFDPAERYQDGAALVSALQQWERTRPDEPQGVVPGVDPQAVTRLQARRWVAPLSVDKRPELRQQWRSDAYRLFIFHPQRPPQIISVSNEQRVLKIGRGAQANGVGIGVIQLPDPHVSRRQATIERAGRGWQVIDHSPGGNGVFLGREKKRLTPEKPDFWRGHEPLHIGDYLLVWQAHDKFGLADEQAEAAYQQDEAAWQRLMARRFWLQTQQEEGLDVTLQPPQALHVKPGEMQELQIVLLNQDAVVERVQVRLDGFPPNWYSVSEDEYALLAGNERPFALQIHPPAMGQAAAGRYDCDVVIYSVVDGQERYRLPYQIHIAPVPGLTVDLHPKTVRGAGSVQLFVWNTGNQETLYRVQARDPADELAFTEADGTLLAPPGQQRHLNILVEPRIRRPLLPPTRQLPFEVRVGETETNLTTLNGRVDLRPLFPGWLLIVLALLLVALFLVVPPVLSRSRTVDDLQNNARALNGAAVATIAAAEATIAVGQDLLAAVPAGEAGAAMLQDNPEMQAVATDVAQAAAAKTGAEAAQQQAAAIEATAAAISPIGPALPPNLPPTAVLLDNNTVPENSPGALVGLLSADDGNDGDLHTFSLAAGEGDADNGLFTIVGAQLVLQGAVDFETQPELSVRVQAADSHGETFAQRLQIVVTDVNEPPTEITLSSNEVEENVLSAPVGELTAVDPDQRDSHTFTLVDDPSNLLEISGGSLRVKTGQALNYEQFHDPAGGGAAEDESFAVTVTAVDGGGHVITATLPIRVTQGNDPPQVMGFGKSLLEDTSVAITRADFTAACRDEDEAEEACALAQIKITLLPASGVLLKAPPGFVYAGTESIVDALIVFEGEEIALNDNGARFNDEVERLLFVPAQDFNGRLQFRWNGSDGDDYAAQDAAVTLTVIPVSDSGSFIPQMDLITVEEDAGPQNFNWATDIFNPDGDPRRLRFVICHNSNPTLFSSGPQINAFSGDLIFTPAEHQNGTAVLQIILTDERPDAQSGNVPICNAVPDEEKTTLTIVVTPVNDAPVLADRDACKEIDLGTHAEGSYAAFTVASLVDKLGDGCLSDPDGAARRWIAVVGVSPNSGAWLYRSSDDGITSWQPFPNNVSGTSAVLLRGSAQISIATTYYGDASLDFRAWDGTLGQPGDTGFDIRETGGESPFSAQVVTVSITLTAVNNRPVIEQITNTIDCLNDDFVILTGSGQITDDDDLGNGDFNFSDGYIDVTLEATETFTETDRFLVTIGQANSGFVRVVNNQVQVDSVTVGDIDSDQDGEATSLRITFNDQATVAAATAVLQRLAYDGPKCNPPGDNFTVIVTISDGGNVGGGALTDSAAIIVTP